MYRLAEKQLLEWKNSKDRKPLVLKGARQVGKTWLLQDFGAKNYNSVAYVNMDNNPAAENIFSIDYDMERIINGLEMLTGTKIIPGETLIILDEIQEIPKALSALKYFCENAPEYHIAVAGSLLGIALHEGTSFPVGKVNFLDIYPLNFVEFLYAISKGQFADAIQNNNYDALQPFHDTLLEYLKDYLIIGGMPAVVNNYIEEGNMLKTRETQLEILTAYEQDFSKHAPANVVPRIREVFNILPSELAKENKKFIFNMIRTGARAKDYEAALLWLEDTGVAKRVLRSNSAKAPLKVYADRSVFKLFLVDVGLLGALSKLDPNIILQGDNIFEEFKGAITEQFVFQELSAAGITPYYYSRDDSRGEIDFMIDIATGILPIEVKSGKNLHSPSLNAFLDANPAVKKAAKLSLLPYRQNDKIDNLPLYFASNLS